jgi:hypothetical protein
MASANVVNTLIVPAASKVAPYYDDFDESKNFHKIMFRPGYAVQARELTQIQTILQNQIERFGRHIFVNGSSVIGGKLDVSDVVTLNVESQYGNSDIVISEFKDKTIIYSSGNTTVQARVIETSEATNTTPACLHVRYLTGDEFSNSATVLTTTGNLYANISAANNVLANISFKSNGSLGFIYDSIYFMQGYFVKVPKQTVVISKHHRQANVKVGLEYQDGIITEYNDASLLEPAQGTSNYQAPGAGRYKVDLILSTRPLDSVDDEKYINVADLENGVIKRRYSNPTYSEIEEVLARRTYDESGNYIVKPFRVKVEDSSSDPTNNFTLSISAGKAYVYGFEAENQATTNLEIPRARETRSRRNYNIPVNYGNYFIVENVRGTFNTNRQGLTDLHCVMWDQVSTTNTATYNATKIGTARVKDINYYGSSNASNTIARQYELYFYDTKFTSITGNVSALNSNTSQITLDTANASAVANAYVGAYIKIISGNAAGDLRYITGYNGTTKTANVSIPFSITTNSSTKYEIRPDITDVDSVYQSSVYTGGATTNAAATISLINKDDGTYNGNTFISEPSFSDSFYTYPASYVAPGTANVSYVYRRVYDSVTFTGGFATITSAINEQFDGVTSTSNTSSAVMDNFLVVVTNSVGSNRSVGDQVKVKTTVTLSTPETCQFDTSNTSESFTATVYSRMQITDPSPRVKTLVKANTSTFSNASPSATFVNPSNSITRVYLSAGQVVIQNPSSSNSESLFISDVIGVPKIYYTPSNPVAFANLKSAAIFTDVTADYTIETGQKNEYYNHAKIRAKGGTVTKPGYLIVCCRYYSHTSDTGFFSVDSYPSLNTMVVEEGINLTTGYALVPTINGIRLTDQVDFRPARPNAANTDSWTFNTARIPIAVTDFTSDFSFYVERRDIVVMTVNDELKLISGNINNRQNYPDTPARSLLLHRIRVLPYTVTKNDIIVDTLDHRRYTMADIGRIDKRVKQLEYTTTLNALEKSATDIVITDVNGLDRTKYGILAEDFTSHLLGDTNNPDYSCAVDITGSFSPTGGILMPRTVTNYIKLQANTSSATNLSVFEDKAMLSYTTTPAISQPFATKSTSLSDYLFADFRGQIITTPESDQWKDVTTRPPEVVSLPEPKIVFDITATDITNITNTTNTTNIDNTYVTPENIETVDVERLLLVTNPSANGFSAASCYLGILQPLRWRAGGGTSSFNGYPFPDGFYTGNLLNGEESWMAPERDVDGNLETVGMKKLQYWHLMDKMVKGTGYPNPGQLSGLSHETYDMVYGFYDVILNRPPDPAGCVFWSIQYVLHKYSYQQLREIITRSALQNGELSQFGPTWDGLINLTPKYLIGADLIASLAGNKKVDISQAGIYNTTTTPDGRIQALAPSDGAAIEEMYQSFLGRKAEPAGKAYWIQIFTEWSAKYGREIAAQMLHDEFKYTAAPLERRGLEDKNGGAWVSSYYFDTD